MHKNTLSRSISIGCFLFIALLCLVLSAVNYTTYKKGLYSRYSSHIRSILNFTRSQIDTDDLAECVKTGQKSDKYLALQHFIDTFKDNTDIHYLYIIRPLNKNPKDNVMDIIAAMSSYEKENMPEMEVKLGGLTGDGYSVESVTKYLNAANKEGISFFVSDWVKDTIYVDYTGTLPLFTSSREYIGLLCVDIDVTEISKVVLASTLLNITLILLLGIIFTVLFILWSNHSIASPIQKLENSVTTFAYKKKENENVESLVIEDPNIHTHNEVESLANAVVKMSQDMQVYVKSVIEAESRAKMLQELANTDALTGIKNKTAYDYYAQEMNKDIFLGQAEFAIVMVDLNHLKKINDTYGHERGNDYITKSCNLICYIFVHSPVFRIGGDEFVIILKGDDYENRKKLIDKANEEFLQKSNNENLKPWERLSAALGLAEFEEGTDSKIEDVFNRADKIMYSNKISMKAQRKV